MRFSPRIQAKISITLARMRRHNIVLTLAAFLLYLWFIYEKLAAFPIYFFCDEAMLGVDAHLLLTTGVDSHGVAWPFFFRELGFYSHSISVYLNMPFVWLFGLNEFAVRLTTACISVLGVLAVYALVRWVYRLRAAWVTFAVFAVSPIWFLHSRTGFEYVMAASFFLAFGLFYILAFSRQWWWVFPAAACAAATFYAHTTGRGWIGIALLLLFVINLPEHIKYWRRLLLGFLALLLLLTPYIHLHLTRPDIAMKRLELLSAYHAVDSQSFATQARRVINNYVSGVNPQFWYTWEHTQNSGPMERHIIPPLPLVPQWTFPFACIGVFMLLWRIRKLENRTLLALFLAAPTSAALVEFNIHRGLSVGTLLIVFAALGIGWSMAALRVVSPALRKTALIAMAIGVGIYAGWFRYYVHQIAPYSYRDYGFYGVQMGAPQVFGWINAHHEQFDQVYLSHDLFNAGQIFIPFYLRGEVARKTRVIDLHQLYKTRNPLPERAVYIAPVKFSLTLRTLGSPLEQTPIYVISDMRGNPLFDVFELRKTDNFEEWFHQEDVRRRQLQQSEVLRNSTPLTVEHPQLDLGSSQALFDGESDTLARTDRINPAHIVVHLPAVPLTDVMVTISHTGKARLRVTTFSGDEQFQWGEQSYTRPPGEHSTVLTFHQPEPIPAVTRLEITMYATETDRYGYVHINEIDWK